MDDYRKTVEYLYGLRLFGTKLGLNNIRRLLELEGNPQEGPDFYHIAGTNGKGSVAAILAELLTRSGFKAGRFTSPHLLDFRERIFLNGRPIPQSLVVELVHKLKKLIPAVVHSSGCTHPTYFEAVTALALLAFRRQEIEAVAWETGLGGRFDATAAVKPKVAVVTTIGLDHRTYLGGTIRKIAAEKAGIIKPGVPTVIGKLPPRAREVLSEGAQRAGSRLISAGSLFQARRVTAREGRMHFDLHTPRGKISGVELALFGRHQVENSLTALAAWWLGTDGGGEEVIRAALSQVSWPGRFEIRRFRNRTIILDGAHNPQGARALARALNLFGPENPPVWLAGILADKDTRGILRALLPATAEVVAVPPGGKRGLPPEELDELFRRENPERTIQLRNSVEDGLNACYRLTKPGGVILVAGSLRLVGQATCLLDGKKLERPPR